MENWWKKYFKKFRERKLAENLQISFCLVKRISPVSVFSVYNANSLGEISCRFIVLIYRIIFKCMSKVIPAFLGYASLRSVISPENLRYSLNQSDAKPKPIAPLPLGFSRALLRLFVFTLPSHLLAIFFLHFLFVLRYSIEKRSIDRLCSQ